MFSRFFIERPIFAIVVSLIICIAGGLALTQLPVEQYPNMSPVQITVTAQYPGADAKTPIRSPPLWKARSTGLTTCCI